LIFGQYGLSKHNLGVVYQEESGRYQCDGCHTGDGYAQAIEIGKNDPVSVGTMKISCKTCHTIHDKYDSTDFGFRMKSSVALRWPSTPLTTVDFKEGNVCARCHQARPITGRTTPDTLKPNGTSSYSRIGPHYGTVANVIAMKGLYDIPGGSQQVPTTNPHMSLSKGCVSCHMNSDAANPAVGGHTFLMPPANIGNVKSSECFTCHDAAQIKKGDRQKEIAGLLKTYRQLLINKSLLDTSQTVGAEGYNVMGEYPATPGGIPQAVPDKVIFECLMNYMFLAKERSYGVHNPAYVKAMLQNGIEYLQTH
jgi:hypothetical protein